MKKQFLLLIFSLFAACMFAQDFNSAVGLRFGYPTSVSYKMFLNEANAVEAYVGIRPLSGGSWIAVNAAYLIHQDLEFEDIDGLQWYYGGGAGLQSVSFTNSDIGTTFFALSGYLGLSYTFDDLPLNLSVDWVPTVFIGGYTGLNSFGGGYGALSARYVLNQ